MSSVQSAPLMSSTALQKERERARELFRRMNGVRSVWPAQLSSHSIRRNGGKSGTRHDSLTDRLAGEMDSKLVIEAKQEGRLARGFKGPRPEPLHFGIDGNIVIGLCERNVANQIYSATVAICHRNEVLFVASDCTMVPATRHSLAPAGWSLCCTLNKT